jgi:outer membrane protein
MMRRLVLVFALVALAAATAASQGRPVVTLDQALETARQKQPDLRVAQASSQSARAAAEGARAAWLPTVDGNVSYGLGAGNPGSVTDPSQSLRASVTGNILLWDFGATKHEVGAADASAEAASDSERQAELDTAFQVRSTYFAARAAKELVGVARENLANQERHLQQVEAFVSVGTRPEIDRYQARTAVSNARVQLIQAENNYDLARVQLARAMGDAAADFDVGDDTMPPVDGEDGTDDALVAEAVRARPDLAALVQSRRVADERILGARASYLPSLSANAGVDGVALGQGGVAWGWSLGVNLSWRIFDGFSRRAQVHAAQADAFAADARKDALLEDVRVEVRQARLAVRAAKASQQAANEALENAKKQLELAEGRYAQGVGNVIELGDAQVQVTTAAALVVQSEFDLATARAQLFHVLGR